MKTVLVMLAVLGLAGCTTYAKMSTRPVAYTATTQKTPQAYADCALPLLMNTNAASHIVALGDVRQIVVPVGGGTPNAVAIVIEATPVNGTTRVAMRHMPALSDFHKQWQQAESCL